MRHERAQTVRGERAKPVRMRSYRAPWTNAAEN